MTVLIYLVPMALLLGLTGLAAFLWSLRSGQYDDVEGAAVRILDDDDIVVHSGTDPCAELRVSTASGCTRRSDRTSSWAHATAYGCRGRA